MDWLRWTPRILAILFTLFTSLFAFGAIEQGMGFWQNLLGFLLHLAPSFVLAITLAVAWRWEKLGGLVFAAYGLTYYFAAHRFNMLTFMVLSIIPIVTGVLFFLRGLTKNINT